MNNVICSTDRFSWRRVAAIWSYYYLTLKPQVIGYLIASFVLSALILIPGLEPVRVGLYLLSHAMLALMFYLAPLIFARGGDARIIDRLIPALPSEKFAFYMLYLLVALPVITYAIPTLTTVIYLNTPSLQSESVMELVDLQWHSGYITMLAGVFETVAYVLTCFYVVMRSNGNRILYGLLAVFVLMIVLGVAGIIMGGTLTFVQGFYDGYTGNECLTGTQLTPYKILEYIQLPMLVLGCLIAAYVAVLIRKIYNVTILGKF